MGQLLPSSRAPVWQRARLQLSPLYLPQSIKVYSSRAIKRVRGSRRPGLQRRSSSRTDLAATAVHTAHTDNLRTRSKRLLAQHVVASHASLAARGHKLQRQQPRQQYQIGLYMQQKQQKKKLVVQSPCVNTTPDHNQHHLQQQHQHHLSGHRQQKLHQQQVPQHALVPTSQWPAAVLKVVVFLQSCCFDLAVCEGSTVGRIRRQVADRLGAEMTPDMLQLSYAGRMLPSRADDEQFRLTPGITQLHVLMRLYGG